MTSLRNAIQMILIYFEKLRTLCYAEHFEINGLSRARNHLRFLPWKTSPFYSKVGKSKQAQVQMCHFRIQPVSILIHDVMTTKVYLLSPRRKERKGGRMKTLWRRRRGQLAWRDDVCQSPDKWSVDVGITQTAVVMSTHLLCTILTYGILMRFSLL